MFILMIIKFSEDEDWSVSDYSIVIWACMTAENPKCCNMLMRAYYNIKKGLTPPIEVFVHTFRALGSYNNPEKLLLIINDYDRTGYGYNGQVLNEIVLALAETNSEDMLDKYLSKMHNYVRDENHETSEEVLLAVAKCYWYKNTDRKNIHIFYVIFIYLFIFLPIYSKLRRGRDAANVMRIAKDFRVDFSHESKVALLNEALLANNATLVPLLLNSLLSSTVPRSNELLCNGAFDRLMQVFSTSII
jgi:hypothetical protein